MRTLPLVAVAIAGCCLCVPRSNVLAAEAKSFGPDPKAYQATVDRAVKFLAGSQKQDGSWANTNERWMEADANLATSFALVALSYCRPKTSK
jgi:hypothetical protein